MSGGIRARETPANGRVLQLERSDAAVGVEVDAERSDATAKDDALYVQFLLFTIGLQPGSILTEDRKRSVFAN